MSIFCLGVNHKTAPVEIREKLAFSQKHLPESLQAILELDSIDGVVVLSTCNRVEVYGASENIPQAFIELRQYLLEHFQVQGQPVEFYQFEREAAANQLFEVAGGLDSMVLGETEIFGQVKKAYADAHAAGTTGKRLNKLFQQSFSIGKLVRNNSKIQHGSTSIGSVAVDVAERIFGCLKNCQVMIIGAGEMSRTTAQSMISRGAKSIIVSNRSYDKAVELAEQLDGKALRFDDWESELPTTDILISSTSAPHPIIERQAIERNMSQRRGRPLFLIDIAVPRDIEDSIRSVNEAYLYNIDQLTEIAEKGKAKREQQIVFCRKLIADYLDDKGIDALRNQPVPNSTEDSTRLSSKSPIPNS